MSSDEESDRPRRLEDGTVVYLLSIAAKLDEAKKLGNDALALEEQEIIVNNVFEEVKGRSASAACDKRTNSIIEQLLLMASLPVLLETMSKFTKYAKFLTLNRHSSHVLQSLFARTGQVLKSSGIPEELEGEATRTTLTIAKAILAPKTLGLAMKDMCGSHVVRSLVSLLAGIPAVGERKSKHAKHQHSHTLAVPLDALMEPDHFYIAKSAAYEVPEEFRTCLVEEVVTGHLLQLSCSELHVCVGNTNSCAVITLLLRILFNPDLVPGGSELASQLLYKILGAPNTDSSKDGPLAPLYAHMVEAAAGRNVDPVTGASLSATSDAAAAHQHTIMAWEPCGEVVADMAENATAAFFLEAVVECADLELVCCMLYYTILLNGTLVDFAASNNANYFVQACFRRLGSALKVLAAEHVQSGGSAGVVLRLNVVRGLVFRVATDLFTTSAVTADGNTTTSIASALYRVVIHRGGVVLWMLDAVRWFDYCGLAVEATGGAALGSKVSLAILQCWLCHHQHSMAGTSPAVTGNVALLTQSSTAVAPVAQGTVNHMIQSRLQPIAAVAGAESANRNKKKKKGKGRPPQSFAAAPSPAADESVGENSGAGNITSQILFAKQLEQVMKQSISPVGGAAVPCKSSKYIVTALSTLPEASLLAVAKQGQLCRPILDTFLTVIIKNTNTSAGAAGGGRKGNSAVYAEDFRRFINTLMGCALDLAVHPTGMHVLKQLFEQCTTFAVREALATLLHTHYEALMAGNTRNIAKVLLLNVCRIDVFHKYGSEEWQRMISDSEREKEEEFLQSLDNQQQQFKQQKGNEADQPDEKEKKEKKSKRSREEEEEQSLRLEKKSKKEKKEKKSKRSREEEEEL